MPRHSTTLGLFICMKFKDWSDYRVFCTGISRIMTHPQGFRAVSKQEQKKRDTILQKETDARSDEDNEFLKYVAKKHEEHKFPPSISESAKDYLIGAYGKAKYNFRTAAIGKQKPTISKGFGLEQDGIRLLSELDGVEYKKSIEVVSDDYFIGVCDVLCPTGEKIVDVKTSWNSASFMMNRKASFKLPATAWWQMQGYLHLYKIQRGQVCYVLVNTPEHLIAQEYANLFRRYSFGEINREKYDLENEKIESAFDYSRIPKKRRVIRFDVEYRPDYMDKVKEKVVLCRKWLNEFEKQFVLNKNIITLPEQYIKANGEDDNPESNTAESCESD